MAIPPWRRWQSGPCRTEKKRRSTAEPWTGLAVFPLIDFSLFFCYPSYIMRLMEIFQKQSKRLFILIFLFSLVLFFTPLSSTATDFVLADKIIHFCLFFLLSFFAFLTWGTPFSRIFLGILFYILLTEVIQHFFIPGRGYSPADVAVDFLSLALIYLLFRYKYVA